MSDPIERMAAALEEQNLLRQQELQQARLDEAHRLQLIAAEEEGARQAALLVAEEAKRNETLEALLTEVRALLRVTTALIDQRAATHANMSTRIDAVLELQRLVVTRMLRDTSDAAELERITSILREVTGTKVSVAGLNVEPGRDATIEAGRDIEVGNTTPRKPRGRRAGTEGG